MSARQPLEERLRLAPEQLARRCDPAGLPFSDTTEVLPLDLTAGQPRALEALDFGLDTRAAGFNLFVSGPIGTGRQSTVLALVKDRASREPVPGDRVFVHNFRDPDQPRFLDLPAGTARRLARETDTRLDQLRLELPRLFESEAFETRRQALMSRFEAERNRILEAVRKEAQEKSFRVQFTDGAVVTVPLLDGEPLRIDRFAELDEDHKKEITEQSETLQASILASVNEIRRLEMRTRRDVRDLEREVAGEYLDSLFAELVGDQEVLADHFAQVRSNILERLDDFRREGEDRGPLAMLEPRRAERLLGAYRINVFVESEAASGAPVVYETNPTYYNLFGGVEYRPHDSQLVTDFTMIRPGAIHRAHGGYLVLQARDVLFNPFSWDALKRTIRSGEARVENLGEQFRLIPVATLKPEPVPVKVKVILLGSPLLHHLLFSLDEDFRKLFKVKAEFDAQMERTPENEALYGRFLASRCAEEDLVPFDDTAVAAVVDHGSRLTEHQNRLSTRFMDIADLAREAAWVAARARRKKVVREHVETALNRRRFRSNLYEDRMQELIDEAVLHIDVTGRAVGQLNGLSVLDLGDYEFGRPSRITARVSLGKEGVIDIERESESAGRIHSKGVLILSGFLSGRYAARSPLSVSLSLCFEQTYDEIEGDSASSTEVYAILSTLADIPIHQGIAVTGSVDQFGNVQAVGGVNEKVEGFFEVCRSRGLNRRQGVVIPRANLQHLMLRREVEEAVRKGRFHLWAVSHVDEGLEILTGVPAGRQRKDGTWTRSSVNALVAERLEVMAEDLREFNRDQ